MLGELAGLAVIGRGMQMMLGGALGSDLGEFPED